MKKWFDNIGPGPLVAAAFIGPGTVTLCSIAGLDYGFSLLWALVLSVFATIVLQEMSARLGIISKKGLSEVIRNEIHNPILKKVIITLILSAIVIGNAAYEAGNISGGVLGLEAVFGENIINLYDLNIKPYSILLGAIAFALLYIGNYKIIERSLIFLVIIMSVSFIATAIITRPDLMDLLHGLLIPKFPKGSILIVIGLIGTTVVPYNLFLHASLVKEKWHNESDLKFARNDTVIAIALGGIVSMCIVISAASLQIESINNAADLAKGIEPLFGASSKYILAIGLFSAGITSAITAPLAASYVAAGCLGWSISLKSKKFRFVWMLILLAGVISSSLGIKSIEIIKFAQITNGILLPIIAGFLIWIVNKESVLGKYINSKWQNVTGLAILLITLFLGLKSLLKVFEIL
ncbi:MAG: Nramp family divalent metal transporter [Flavobacteriaceae bacterium]|jgi:Mn2+/Fe2+ NRAMP family transporter|nr:Nramp family divalent metal transporter [Flavobacteriaceae bacterium]MBT6689180.1 Nramp family divalent metal transporter [Flavobacteriaceae bacterium]MBT7320200.1 Nramp family divalent metal transporter [Flavobacteriaceae bacterium]MBT7555054.1 Nramp family divalent metal transporter [Flavobacteriaceae bacterium]